MSPNHERETLLTARADLARSRLSATLSALDRKRHDVLDVPLQLTKHIALVGAVAGAAIAGIAVFGIYRMATSGRRVRHERWLLLQRAWSHPDRVAPKEPSLFAKLAKAGAVALARYVVAKVMAAQRASHEDALALPEATPVDRL